MAHDEIGFIAGADTAFAQAGGDEAVDVAFEDYADAVDAKEREAEEGGEEVGAPGYEGGEPGWAAVGGEEEDGGSDGVGGGGGEKGGGWCGGGAGGGGWRWCVG